MIFFLSDSVSLIELYIVYIFVSMSRGTKEKVLIQHFLLFLLPPRHGSSG